MLAALKTIELIFLHIKSRRLEIIGFCFDCDLRLKLAIIFRFPCMLTSFASDVSKQISMNLRLIFHLKLPTVIVDNVADVNVNKKRH